jgi:serine protease Do
MEERRREFLQSVSGLFMYSNSEQTSNQEDCSNNLEEIKQHLQAIEAEMAGLREEMHDNQHRVDEIYEEVQQITDGSGSGSAGEQYEYTKEIHEKAETVGTELRKAVVDIELDFTNGESGGTGWFIDENTILTNAHVVNGLVNRDPDLYVHTLNGNQVDATLERIADRSSGEPDVAVLKTTDSAPHTPEIGSDSTLEEGDKLVRVGHPYTVGHWAMGLGEVLGTNRETIVQAELPIGGGHSGSPVITLEGKVIGMSHATSRRGEYIPPEEPPEPVPAEIKPEYDQEENSKVRVIRMSTIDSWRSN